jgi:hypothetical protein
MAAKQRSTQSVTMTVNAPYWPGRVRQALT